MKGRWETIDETVAGRDRPAVVSGSGDRCALHMLPGEAIGSEFHHLARNIQILAPALGQP